MTVTAAALVVNVRSRRGQRQFAQARDALAALPFRLEAHGIEDPDELVPTVTRAIAGGCDLIVLGGGDGTISSTVDCLVGHGAKLAILPLGTANSFARSLDVPLDVDGAVRVIADGHSRRIDLGMIDGDYFANCAALGISPQIAQTVPHGLKKVAGRLGYLCWAAWQFLRFEPFTLVVTGDDGVPHRLRVVEVRVSNGAYHGGTKLVDDARLDSGEIVVQAVVGDDRFTLVRHWAAAVAGSEARHRDTREFRGRSLRVETEPPLPVSIDGEVLAQTPVTARIAAGVIEVMAPR